MVIFGGDSTWVAASTVSQLRSVSGRESGDRDQKQQKFPNSSWKVLFVAIYSEGVALNLGALKAHIQIM